MSLREKLKNYWVLLHQDIFVGDMREQNMRACFWVGVAVTLVASTNTTLNLIWNRDPITIFTTISQAIGGIIIIIFILRDEKKIPTISMMMICIITFTYYIFSGASGGSTIIWTMLVPIGIGYFGNALYGIYCGIYSEILCIVAFYTPLRNLLDVHYTKLFMDRFPILYLLNLILDAICLVNYHVSVLKLMDYAKQMIKSKEEADRANRGKSDFLSNMSHEIRTPINAVLGMNEMILRESLNANNRLPEDSETVKQLFADICKYSGNIESAGNNLLYLINDILDFSKIESGKMQLVETDYKFSSVLNDVSNMIFFKAKDKGLEFDVDVDSDIPDDLHGDEIRVRQIIINLLNNAVKYTKEGYVHLKVSGQKVSESSSKEAIVLIISVSDTGIGIKEEDIQKLFTKFERVDLEQNSTVEGTGLGLAITKNLLEMMGGKISVESVYNEGSTFTVHLPQIVVSDEPVGDFRKKFDESLQNMDEYVESFHAPDAHILIVDDTKMNLVVVEGLLNHTGLKIDIATSGEESIRMAKDNKYDIILMDQRMPGMNGTEAMQHIREQKGLNTDTPFICLTADAISGAKERYMKAGFVDYITKPIDYKALEKTLITYLPKDKVEINCSKKETAVSDNVKTKNTELPKEYDMLIDAGISAETGMRYCSNNWEFYVSVIRDYVAGYSQRYENLKRYYDLKDWDNYETTVHALKSTSKTIGANELSEKAAGLEKAAGELNTSYLTDKHEDMMKEYEELISSIKTVFPDFDDVTEEAYDILEFSPD
jgi:signal transduction histidine kinase/FixJ family two-component response regulator